MDIGGTLAKAAQLLAPGEGHISPSTFGKTGTFHKELSFQLKVGWRKSLHMFIRIYDNMFIKHDLNRMFLRLEINEFPTKIVGLAGRFASLIAYATLIQLLPGFLCQVKNITHDVHFLSGATYYLEPWCSFQHTPFLSSFMFRLDSRSSPRKKLASNLDYHISPGSLGVQTS